MEKPKQANKDIDSDSVCMTRKEYERMLETKANNANNATSSVETSKRANVSLDRDYRVIDDQLYPPLNRTDTSTYTMLERNIAKRDMYVSTNDTLDNYRLVGYLINKGDKDAGGNNWKLFARQKDRYTSDFYIVPSNNNYDIKINIKDEMIIGERLRDVYTIPKMITFQSPMLNTTPYEFVEIPKADLAVSSRYL